MATENNEMHLADVQGPPPQGNTAETTTSGDTNLPALANQEDDHINFRGASSFLRVVIQHLFGCTNLHLLPVPPTMSRGRVMTEVLNLRDKQVSFFVRVVEGVYTMDTAEIVSISNTQCPAAVNEAEPIETALLGLGTQCAELTQALRKPHLFTLAQDGPFLGKHEELLSTAMPPKALHVASELRKGSLVITFVFAMIIALVGGTLAGGLVVGFGCASVVGALGGATYCRFK